MPRNGNSRDNAAVSVSFNLLFIIQPALRRVPCVFWVKYLRIPGPSETIDFLLVFKAKSHMEIPMRKHHEFPMKMNYFSGISRNSASFIGKIIMVFDRGSHLRENAWISQVCSPVRESLKSQFSRACFSFSFILFIIYSGAQSEPATPWLVGFYSAVSVSYLGYIYLLSPCAPGWNWN